jgi:alpha-methylacyl-CoA racemase
MSRKPAQGPLVGIKILDLTRLLPGPLATQMLADLGAEVIKIEDPKAPDYTRHFFPQKGGMAISFITLNRSKKSLALDLKSEKGRKIFYDLAKEADIVLDSFRPGVLAKMGLDYDTVKTINPRIIYVAVTGYGQTGPYAQAAGHDINYIGYTGLLSLNGTQENGPVMPAVQIADIAGGSYPTVIACLSALLARQTTGEGQFVDVAMTDCTLPLMSMSLAETLNFGQTFGREEPFLSGGLAHYNLYKCADGEYVALGSLEPKFWQGFCMLINKPDWIARMLPQKETVAALKQDLTALFLTKTRDEWVALAAQVDICLTPILNTHEVESNEHIRARGLIVESEHPEYGKVKGINQPIQFSGTPTAPGWAAAKMGEDNDAILKEMGYTEEAIHSLRSEKVIV